MKQIWMRGLESLRFYSENLGNYTERDKSIFWSVTNPQGDSKKMRVMIEIKGSIQTNLRDSLSSTPSVIYLITVRADVRSSNRIA